MILEHTDLKTKNFEVYCLKQKGDFMKLFETKKLQDGISGVYLIICNNNATRYVGSSLDVKKRAGKHIANLIAGRHQNRKLQSAFDEYGIDAFDWKMLQEYRGDHQQLKDLERDWFLRIQSSGSKMFNVLVPGTGTSGMRFKRTSEVCQKLSDIAKKRVREEGLPDGFGGPTFLGRKHTEQSKEKLRKSHTGILNGMYEKHLGEEARLELSASRIGVSFSEEHKKKISESKKGKSNGHDGMKYSKEWRNNISSSLKGKTTWAKGKHFSEEHKKKIADSNRGKTMTEQSKQKIREARKKQVMPKWTPERREKFKQTWRQKKERQNEQVEN